MSGLAREVRNNFRPLDNEALAYALLEPGIDTGFNGEAVAGQWRRCDLCLRHRPGDAFFVDVT